MKSKEEEPGAGEDDQIVLFLSMLDGVCDEHEGVRASDPVTYCQLVEDELVELAIGYGEDYGAEHAVRSATSPDFPSTSLFPHHPLSQTPFSSVVDMQPDRNGHGGEILRVMGGGVTVSQVGAAYGVGGWLGGNLYALHLEGPPGHRPRAECPHEIGEVRAHLQEGHGLSCQPFCLHQLVERSFHTVEAARVQRGGLVSCGPAGWPTD